MITMKSAIREALINDQAVVALLENEPRVYAVKAPNADEYPRVSFFEITNLDANHADDQPYSTRMIYQVDIWSKKNPDPIAVEVDRVLKSNGFVRVGGADLYEDDTQVFHRALRYGILKEV